MMGIDTILQVLNCCEMRKGKVGVVAHGRSRELQLARIPVALAHGPS